MNIKKLTSTDYEKSESFIKLSRSLIEEMNSDENAELDIYHLVVIKSLANNFQKAAFTGVNHLMRFIGMNMEQSSTKSRTNNSLVRLQENGHIEIYEDIKMKKRIYKLKNSTDYFIKPTAKDENENFAKVFYEDIQKIIFMKSNYKSKIFAVYLNIICYLYYNQTTHPLSYIKIDTIVDQTNIKRKTVIEFLKLLVEYKIIYCVNIHIKKGIVRNYYTRWIHKEYTQGWAVGRAEINYRTEQSKFISENIGVSDEKGIS